MSPNLKKILLSLALVVTAGVFGFLMYYFFFRAPVAPVRPKPVAPGVGVLEPGAPGRPPGVVVTPGAPGVLPPSEQVRLPTFAPTTPAPVSAVLTETRAENIKLLPTGDGAAYYDPNTGKFFRIRADGTQELMSDRTFFGVSDVTWAPKTDKAVLEFPDGANVLYNFSTNTQVTLPKHWEEFDFDPEGSKIAAKSIGLDEESRWLFVANGDGTQATPVETLGANGDLVDIAWSPNNQVVAFARTGLPRDGNSQEIIPIGLNNENFKALVVPGFGFEPQWAPDGQNLLFSVYNKNSDYRPTLWIAGGSGDNIGTNRQNLQIQTWADKCSFQNSSTLYCAVPTNLEQGAALERDVARQTPDSIYKIDLTTGTRQIILPASGDAVKTLTTSPDGRYLFYTDEATGRLHKVELK